jgi:acyl-CoA thioester hydrolase|tara:strand:- start:1836 stop:2246 length:411 start_codon:yes stop_codon:yes gene_type:complete
MSKVIKCDDLNYKVYVEDTDFQGIVYYANYLKYFERSRSEFLSKNGIFQKMLIKEDSAFVIKEIKLNYKSPAELGDEIIVQSNVMKKSDARMIFFQKVISKKDSTEHVNGEVEVCFINLMTKKPQKFPNDLLLIFD